MTALRVAGRFLLALLLAVLTIEVSFRLAGALLPVDRGDAALAGEHVVVLCVGDSHTWGRGKGYPSRIAARLAERSDRFRVLNLGVPGSNSAQLRNRFERYLDDYRPALVVVWVGLNNRWNLAETRGRTASGEPAASWLNDLLYMVVETIDREGYLTRAAAGG